MRHPAILTFYSPIRSIIGSHFVLLGTGDIGSNTARRLKALGARVTGVCRSGVSDETLREAVAAGIYGKPRQHEFCSETTENEAGKEEKNMSFIGG